MRTVIHCWATDSTKEFQSFRERFNGVDFRDNGEENMIDLEKNTTAFGLLTMGEKEKIWEALRNPNAVLKEYTGLMSEDPWEESRTFSRLNNKIVYRVFIPESLEMPSVDWDQVSKIFNWLAVDPDSLPYLYTDKPYVEDDYGWSSTGIEVCADVFSNFSAGNAPWDKSLVKRPGYEGD